MSTPKKKSSKPASASLTRSLPIDPDSLPLEPPKVKLSREARAHAKSPDRVHAEHFAAGRVCANLCQDRSCVTLLETTGYCRLFYIKNWQQIQRKNGVLSGGQLEKYIAEIASKYPDKYLEAIRGDLADIGSFQSVVSTLDIEMTDEDLHSDSSDSGDAAEEVIERVAVDDTDDS